MSGGSPSLRRSLVIVTETMLLNGSTSASQTCSSSSSALTTCAVGGQQHLQDPELLAGQRERTRAAAGAVPGRSTLRSPRRMTGGVDGARRGAPAPGRRARRTRMACPGSRRRLSSRPSTRSSTSAAAVSMRIRGPDPARVRHTSSPCTTGRSRSSTITSYAVCAAASAPPRRRTRRRRPSRPGAAPGRSVRPASHDPRPPTLASGQLCAGRVTSVRQRR